MKYLWMTTMIVGMAVGVQAGEIKAIVGDMPISGYDVVERVRLMKLQQPSQTQGVDEKKLTQKALQSLIDEFIKSQEAKKQGFSVSDKDVDDAVKRLEKQNNMPAGHMRNLLKQADIRSEALYRQVRSDLLWLQVLGQNKSALEAVTDEEIQNKKVSLIKELAQPMYLLAEIIVPTKEQADAVVHILRQGQPFSEVARQKSIASSASENGLLGWVQADVYQPEVMVRVKKLRLNEMTAPIMTDKGWLIVLLLDKQDGAKDGQMVVWDLAQLAVPKHKTADYIPELFKMTTCQEFLAFANKNAIKETVHRGMTDPNKMPPQLKQGLRTQKNGVAVGPVQTEEGDVFFMKCGEEKQTLLPSDEMIKSALEMQKMDDLSEKLLRQAKRYSVVEYK